MSIEFETIADNCTPRNALFCCRSPVCLNNSPKLVPVKPNTTMDSQQQQQQEHGGQVFPVRVPDLSDAGFYTSLMTQQQPPPQPAPKLLNNDLIQSREPNASSSSPSTPTGTSGAQMLHSNQSAPKMHEINKSQSAQDIRAYGVSLRRVTPPKAIVGVKKSDNPLMNVVLRKVPKLIHIHILLGREFCSLFDGPNTF